jgi:glucose 1-dehydrogenase
MKQYYTEHHVPEPVLPKCPVPDRLRGQSALVTGAASGIGRAVAIALGQAGANVCVNYVHGREEAEKTANRIRQSGVKAFPHKADVSIEEDVQAMFARVQEEFGSLEILVNNAGIQKDAPFVELTVEQWDQVIAVNLRGQFLCAREAVRIFLRQGIREEVSCSAGKIIAMSSVHDIIPWAGHVNYAASKGGVALMMKSIAQEVAGDRVRANIISPGAIRTRINEEAWSTPEAYADLMKLIPYKRIGETEEIGRLAVWLASDDSDYINGATIYIDGGMTLYPGFETGG